jgi:hypothetical protein
VERSGNGEQSFANDIEEKPKHDEAEQALGKLENADPFFVSSGRRLRQFLKTGTANNPVIVFGDTFAAEELATLEATRRGFAPGMIKATLVFQV